MKTKKAKKLARTKKTAKKTVQPKIVVYRGEEEIIVSLNEKETIKDWFGGESFRRIEDYTREEIDNPDVLISSRMSLV